MDLCEPKTCTVISHGGRIVGAFVRDDKISNLGVNAVLLGLGFDIGFDGSRGNRRWLRRGWARSDFLRLSGGYGEERFLARLRGIWFDFDDSGREEDFKSYCEPDDGERDCDTFFEVFHLIAFGDYRAYFRAVSA